MVRLVIASQAIAMPPAQPAAPVNLEAQQVANLDGRAFERPYGRSALVYAVQALIDISPLMKPFLEPAFGYAPDGMPTEEDLFDLLCTFGSFCMPDDPMRPGDLVHDGGDGWTLAAGASMGLHSNGDWTGWELRALGPVVQHWRPSAGLVIDPASPTGAFWGPALSRWRSVLSSMQSAAYFAEHFVAEAFGHTGLSVERAALLRTLAAETQAVEEVALIRPGTILLDDDPDRAALVITDSGLCRSAGTGHGLDFYLTNVEGSGCSWLWIPQVA